MKTLYEIVATKRPNFDIFGASTYIIVKNHHFRHRDLRKSRKFRREKRTFRFESGSTNKEQIMNNEKILHANWKFIERKSETFIPMALMSTLNTLSCGRSGKIKFCQNETPFTRDRIRMVTILI